MSVGEGLSIIDRNRAKRRYRVRLFGDRLVRSIVHVGGIAVLLAITLIFFYLAYVVLPLFEPAKLDALGSYPVPGAEHGATAALVMDERGGLAARLTRSGAVVYHDTATGLIEQVLQVPLPDGATITSVGDDSVDRAPVVLGLDDGRVLIVEPAFAERFEDRRRLLTPRLDYPLGEAPLMVDPEGRAITAAALQITAKGAGLLALTADGRVRYVRWRGGRALVPRDDVMFERVGQGSAALPRPGHRVFLEPELRRGFVVDGAGGVVALRLGPTGDLSLGPRVIAAPAGEDLGAVSLLLGGKSLLLSDRPGEISQWFLVRDEANAFRLERVRSFTLADAPITAIAPEQRRRGFLAADTEGRIGIYFSTSERTLFERAVVDVSIRDLHISPRSQRLLVVDARGTVHAYRVTNPHPEISWHALWGRVWYEGYSEPAYVWQSSSADADSEAKFSLWPLTIGTFKAAFYALLFAAPLAIMGAIYSAYFMAPRLRSTVKPTIEIMEALPTVILGFLAGIWLAPIVERHLPGVVALILLVPLAALLLALAYARLPLMLRNRISGWEVLVLVPVVVALGWGAMEISPLVETALFGGNVRSWLSERGVDYDQRNALVVGIAMGFAVIPTIFSLAEDAVYGVPRHLSLGSLALGASPWQTMVRVVLPTASPGLFAALMMGLGRAVGETMIVLMATGSTPITDWNIFEGMRTLSANIAMEMPEVEPQSSHYRVLFLSALLLFCITFVINTIAELVRQSLRRRYSNL